MNLHFLELLFAAALLGPLVGAQTTLPGDFVPAPAIGGSRHSSIARGGPGYLVVWEDTRTALNPGISAAGEPLLGNQIDVYGIRLDLSGRVLDPAPLVICNLPRNQTRPRVAWNGTHWLVVFTTERPDWYFFHDIVGVRVDATGTVLDPTPIAIRPELSTPSNYYGTSPEIGSDGTNWVVVWEDWNPANGHPLARGARIASNGQVIDPNWVTLYEYPFPSFGPREPQISFANGEFLAVWKDAATAAVIGRRLSTSLTPLSPTFTITNYGPTVRMAVASDGTQHYIASNDRLFRVSSTGTVLDPNGITVASFGYGLEQAVALAWNGSSLSVVQSLATAGRSDLLLRRVAANGQILDPSPIPITSFPDDDFSPVVAGDLGHTEVAYVALDPALQRLEDYRAIHVDAAGVASAPASIDAGLPRQQDVHAIATPSGHLVVYLSKSSLGTRFLAQRVDAYGNAIDIIPIEIATWHIESMRRPAVAFNGQVFMFAWNTDAGATLIRRYDAQLQALDAQPVQVFTAATGSPSIAALNSDFMVVGTYNISIDRSYLRGTRVRGSDSVLLDIAPLAIAGNFVRDSWVETFGARYLVYWVHSATHDSPVTTIEATFVDATGLVQPAFQMSTTYYAAHPDLAWEGTDGVLVYHTGAHGEDGIRAQRISDNGALIGSEFVVCDEPTGQMFPVVSSAGPDWVVAWNDYRAISGVEQWRSDIYAARVRRNGTVIDTHGIRITSYPLSEDLPELSTNGSTLLFFSAFDLGGAPHEVPRIVFEPIDTLVSPAWRRVPAGSSGVGGVPALAGSGDLDAGSTLTLTVGGARPSAPMILCIGASRLDLPTFGGILIPYPGIVLTLSTDPFGSASFATPWPAGIPAGIRLWHQAWIADAAGISGLSSTNGLESTSR